MADKWLLQDGSGSWLLQDGSGYWILQAQAGTPVPEESDSWYAGVQLAFAPLAASLVLAGNAQAAKVAQQVTTTDQAEIYSPVSRAGTGFIAPIFIDGAKVTIVQPWVYEQHDRASPPLDHGEYQPPPPWPATTSQPVLDTDVWVEPPPPPLGVQEDAYAPPPPWDVGPQPLYYYEPDEWPTPPPPPVEMVESDPWPLPTPWPATTAQPFTEEYFAPLPPPPELRVVEDQYMPPRPWGQGYVLLPIGGGGSRIDQFQVGSIQVTEDQYQPPAPWPVPARPLYWFPQDEWPTPPPPLQVSGDDTPPKFPAFVEPNVMLFMVDQAPPFPITEDEYRPPPPWPAQVRIPDPWWDGAERPQTAAPLGVEPDPWPLPQPWPASAHAHPLHIPDEWPTFVPPVGLDVDPWPLPRPWVVPTQPLLAWDHDEIASVAALGQEASSDDRVLRVWPVPVPPQPVIGEDERPVAAPIAWESDELFPKVTPERIWYVPQPWEIEQHLIAFLSPHTPVRIRDVSQARYQVENVSGKRYTIRDDSATRYGVEEQ